MYKILNIKSGIYEDFSTIIEAKIDAINMIKLNIQPTPKATKIDCNKRDQEAAEHAVNMQLASDLYFEFFGVQRSCVYYYSIFDLVNNRSMGDAYYFPRVDNDGVSQEEVLVKIKDNVVLEIYHKPNNTTLHKALTYDLITKEPKFYYLNNDCAKYDYYTNELLATSYEGGVSPDFDINAALRYHPEIEQSRIRVNGARPYGYIVEYIKTTPMTINENYEQDKLDFLEYLKASKYLSCIYESLDENGYIITEVIDTDPWIDEIDFEWD
jgi:hypothetical protein